jgi:hypothetical protein
MGVDAHSSGHLTASGVLNQEITHEPTAHNQTLFAGLLFIVRFIETGPFENQRWRRQQPLHQPSAELMRLQFRLVHVLEHFEIVAALIAVILVQRHYIFGRTNNRTGNRYRRFPVKLLGGFEPHLRFCKR